ncbi:MAG: ABC transporter ATP-binding protein, partial [Actinomycetes bacterium]
TVQGGVAPLIELTGGLKSDLTARDNIYLVAGLHGLSKTEVKKRFNNIVEFAEVGDFLDTPVRHFSSGMKIQV